MGGSCGKTPQTAPAPAPTRTSSTTAPAAPAPWSAEALKEAVDAMPAVLKGLGNNLKPSRPMPQAPSAARATAMFDWEFDVFSVPYSELPELAYAALTAHPELSATISKIDHGKLWRYLCELASFYHARPFHSFRHGVDVLLATSTLLRLVLRDKPDAIGDPIVVGALLVAALAHDVNHPGCMNGYLIATKHPLAEASSTAVLERHHAEVALTLLDTPKLDFLADLPEADRARFVSTVREAVMATDVTTSVPKAKEFQALCEGGDTPTPTQVFSLIIKAADISNPARSLPVYEKWIDGVMTEFFVQGDAEAAAGLPFSMNCDRASVVVSKSQVGFITFLVAPLFHALLVFAPSIAPIVQMLDGNKAHFAAIAA